MAKFFWAPNPASEKEAESERKRNRRKGNFSLSGMCAFVCLVYTFLKEKSIFLGKNLEIIPSVRQMEQLERSNMKFNKF